MQLLPDPTRQTVVILEDDQSMVFLWEVLLEEIDPELKVQAFHNAADAEAYLQGPQGAQCRGVISDLYLLGARTGLELWDRIRIAKIPFLLATAFSQEELKEMQPKRTDWPEYASKAQGVDHLVMAAAGILGVREAISGRKARSLTLA